MAESFNIDELVKKLTEISNKGNTVEMKNKYQFTTTLKKLTV